jgi:hypothetical protein
MHIQHLTGDVCLSQIVPKSSSLEWHRRAGKCQCVDLVIHLLDSFVTRLMPNSLLTYETALRKWSTAIDVTLNGVWSARRPTAVAQRMVLAELG